MERVKITTTATRVKLPHEEDEIREGSLTNQLKRVLLDYGLFNIDFDLEIEEVLQPIDSDEKLNLSPPMYSENLQVHIKTIQAIAKTLESPHLRSQAEFEKVLTESETNVALAIATLTNSIIEEIIEKDEDPELAYDFLESLIIQLLRLTKI